MKLVEIDVKLQPLSLIKPYRIANKTIDSVPNCLVTIKLKNGIVGLGAAAPIDFVTGETMASCLQALDASNTSWMLGQSIYCLPAITRQLHTKLKQFPAARAALDIALYDAYGKLCKLPIVDILGRVHHSLPTSITIGIKDLQAAISEAEEYIGRGFKILKIKLGEDLEKDLETVRVIKKRIPADVKIRVDMNQGYKPEDLQRFVQQTEKLDLELIEQPFSKAQFHFLNQFPNEIKNKIAADESMVSVEDAFKLVSQERLCGIFNIKLMKCGGISPALEIARLARLGNVDLMWGCMDESRISIAAALHAALASTQTKYLDLDGSFDLAEDLVQGGFVLENGHLRTTDGYGLGLV